MEPLEMPIPMSTPHASVGSDVPVTDAAIASEVSRHVEADSAITIAGAAAGCTPDNGNAGSSEDANTHANDDNSLDITSGLWLDHPQEATAAVAAAAACGDAERHGGDDNDNDDDSSPLMMYGLGLSAPAVSVTAGGVGGNGGGGLGGLSLPSLDEEEVLGFLACAEEGSNGNRPIAVGGNGFDI